MVESKEWVVSDSSSLILLTKARVINEFLEKRKIYITPIVEKEAVERGKEKGKKDAFQLEKLEEQGKIQVKKPNKGDTEEIQRLFSLHKGEKESVALAKQLKTALLCDDKKAFNACEVMNIPHTTALNILTAMHRNNQITKEKARKSLEKLKRFGWYEEKLIKNAEAKIGE